MGWPQRRRQVTLVQRTLPPWFKVRFPGGPNYLRLKTLMREQRLHTICEEAHCPNIGECWEYGTATFLILGDICTRACAYCAVTRGRPYAIDEGEPARVAQSVKTLGLKHAVITSPNRDDLADGGAAVYAETICQVREQAPGCVIEVLIPDFMGDRAALGTVIEAGPDVLNHNIETAQRLFKRVRAKGDYARSIELLDAVKDMAPRMVTKSGIIVGMGETNAEVRETMADLREARVEVLTLGQYLRPSEKHIAIDRFVTPEEFASLKGDGLAMGFRHVESGPLVRSSYHAHEHVAERAS
ncbi:MAG: lipoyl synthase [Dehalococcoidia bacterium]|nr:lipoyl synthase [Dehalococcoidia bacterium]